MGCLPQTCLEHFLIFGNRVISSLRNLVHSILKYISDQHCCLWWSVASFTKEVNSQLAKRPLKTNGRLANCGLTSLVKEVIDVYSTLWHVQYIPGVGRSACTRRLPGHQRYDRHSCLKSKAWLGSHWKEKILTSRKICHIEYGTIFPLYSSFLWLSLMTIVLSGPLA